LTWFDQPEVQAAIVTFIASILVAIITAKLTLKNDERIKHLEKNLEKQQSEDKARLDYEYEAKKRLYQEYEQLLFQLHELSESTLIRIMNLTRASRNGHLSNNSWLSKKEDYYLRSRAYRILAPMVIFKLMQRRLTLFDLKLNSYFNTQYVLAKILYLTFAKAFNIAATIPEIDYYPFSDEKTHKQSRRQDIVIGIIDNLLEELIEYDDHNKIYRIMSYGNFEKRLCEDRKFSNLFDNIFDIFLDFHPKEEPVLWRILIIQSLIHKLLLSNTEEQQLKIDENHFYQILYEDEKKFDWRTEDDKKNISKERVEQEFKAAAKYLVETLNNSYI
jgi:hypothetical protein